MNRRSFAAFLVAAAFGWPFAGNAQRSAMPAIDLFKVGGAVMKFFAWRNASEH
jgi:hypothetical protein